MVLVVVFAVQCAAAFGISFVFVAASLPAVQVLPLHFSDVNTIEEVGTAENR